MIESGAIVELSNNKKYMIAESSIEDGNVYYLALEVDYQTEIPQNKTVFFQQQRDSLIPVTEQSDISFLETIFYDKFVEQVMSE